MKTIPVSRLAWIVALTLLFAWHAPCAAGDFTPQQMKKMGVFLSNFTELCFCNVDRRDFLNPLNPEMAIRFGIRHNYLNNFNTRVKRCKASCPYGSLAIEGKYVAESIYKYLGFKFDRHQSIKSDYITCHYDGKFYHIDGIDAENVSYARVLKATKISEGVIRLSGELYNPDDPSDILGTFSAEITPSEWKGKPSWNLLNISCKKYD